MTLELELTLDLEDLQKLRTISTRPNVQSSLDAEIARVTELIKKAKADNKQRIADESAKALSSSSTSQNMPTKKLTTFAFDESEKYVKLYYTLNGVQNIPKDSIRSDFTDNSFNVCIQNLNGVNYVFGARDLTDYIDSNNSTIKQKTDCILVMLKKLKEGTMWGKLLALEKKSDIDVPSFDDSSDPQEGMMKMMKKLYDEGDDEMKRTIKKSFYESNQKKGGGALGNLGI